MEENLRDAIRTARNRKAQLESVVLRSVQQFENETGISVGKIDLVHSTGIVGHKSTVAVYCLVDLMGPDE